MYLCNVSNHSRHKFRFLIILAVFLGCLALAVNVLLMNADRLLTGYADYKLREALAKSDSFDMSYSRLDLNLAKGTVSLSDVSFSKDSLKAIAKKIETGNIDLRKVWKTRELLLDYIKADGVKVSYVQTPNTKSIAKDTAKKPEGVKLSGLQKYLDTIGVEKVILNGGDFSFRRLGSHLALGVGDISLGLGDFGYGISSGKFSYCDSLYDLRVNNLAFISADGLYALSADTLATKNSGSIAISSLHGRNTVGKRELSAIKGKIPASWTDLRIKHLRTSAINLARMVCSRKISIDSIFVTGEQLTVFRDNRYAPKKAFKMLQESLTSISTPLHIGYVDLSMPYLTMEILPQKGKTGALHLHDVSAVVRKISNAPENTMEARIRPRLGKGRGDLHLNLKNDNNCSFSVKALVNNVKGSDFESLLKPMFGVSVSADIKSLNSSVSADRHSASGSFCMLYENLKVTVEDPAILGKRFSNKVGLVNKLAGAAIHKQNPRKHQEEPYSCEVSATRDPMKNFGGYLVSVLLDGMEKTCLRELTYKEAEKLKSKGNEIKEKKNAIFEKVKDTKEKVKDKKEKLKEKIKNKKNSTL